MIKIGEAPMENPTQQEHAQIVKEEMIREMDMGLDHIQVCLGRMYGMSEQQRREQLEAIRLVSAEIARELDIVLTSRPVGNGLRVPLAGIPYHALDSYLARLIIPLAGMAIVEQLCAEGCRVTFSSTVLPSALRFSTKAVIPSHGSREV
jgi:hypothetical protein